MCEGGGRGQASVPRGTDDWRRVNMGKGWVKEGARPVGTRCETWPKSQVKATSIVADGAGG